MFYLLTTWETISEDQQRRLEQFPSRELAEDRCRDLTNDWLEENVSIVHTILELVKGLFT